MRPLLLLCACLPAMALAQSANPSYRAKYYYKNHDSANVVFYIKPDAKTVAFFKKENLVFTDSFSYQARPAQGFDSIISVSQRVFTAPFFIKNTEVTNQEYREFATEMKAPFYQPDTAVWYEIDAEDNIHPFVNYYYQNKAYNAYPVVGISFYQAQYFCKWKTIKINEALRKAGVLNYEAEVSLPSETEFNTAIIKYNFGWLKSAQNTCGYNPSHSYISYAIGCGQFRCNFKSITTERGAELKPVMDKTWQAFGFTVTPALSYQNALGVFNLMGNVEEWTLTTGTQNLYNNLQYIYTTTGNIIANTQTRIDSNALNKYIYTPDALKNCAAVKGGSWTDDIYYLQPEAVKFYPQWYKSKSLGFRYVVHLRKTKP